MFEELSQRVRLVVSCRPGECLAKLRERLPSQNMVVLEPMTVEEGWLLLAQWQAHTRHTLTAEQKNFILKGLRGSGLPLYLKLMFDQARRGGWSDEGMEPCIDLNDALRGF